ncbi:MAG: hypothetical protein AAFY82_00180 [Pseudomonadota bacterium]
MRFLAVLAAWLIGAGISFWFMTRAANHIRNDRLTIALGECRRAATIVAKHQGGADAPS